MAKGGFKEASGSNEDIISMIEVQGTVYVATAGSIYRLVSRDFKYVVEELQFTIEDTP